MVLGQLATKDNSPPDKNKPQPLPSGAMIPRTIPHQDNSPLGPMPRNKPLIRTNIYMVGNCPGGELSGYAQDIRLLQHIDANSFVLSIFRDFCPEVACGGVVVYWSIHSTLTLRARVRISPSTHTFVLQQGNLSTLLLLTQVYKWGPSRMCHYHRLLPREWKLCTVSVALKCIQWPG